MDVVAIGVSQETWLEELVRQKLDGYDPETARSRLRAEVGDFSAERSRADEQTRAVTVRSLRRRAGVDPRGGDLVAAFLLPFEEQIDLALDLALIHGQPFELERRRSEIAVMFAAITGEFRAALAADPSRHGPSAPATRKAFLKAGTVLRKQHHPPSDPVLGLPLYDGALVIQRRQLARIAAAYYEAGRLDREVAQRELERAGEETALLVEALAGLFSVERAVESDRHRVQKRQVSRLGLSKMANRAACKALLSPRPPKEIARAAPEETRVFLIEQLLLADLAREPHQPAAREIVQAYADAAQLGPAELTRMELEAAAFSADQRQWLEAFGGSIPKEWEALDSDWESMRDRMVERAVAAVVQNFEAIVTEAKETGELGQLLAKAAAGRTLTPEEKQKVKAQLIDLAKAVPALAILAAPGGLLLLPLLAKVLPFNMLPDAWRETDETPSPRGGNTSGK